MKKLFVTLFLIALTAWFIFETAPKIAAGIIGAYDTTQDED